jgi:hypothetical protein
VSVTSNQPCVFQYFSDFCDNPDIKKQLEFKQPVFVTGNDIRIGYPRRQRHETDHKLNRDPDPADTL